MHTFGNQKNLSLYASLVLAVMAGALFVVYHNSGFDRESYRSMVEKSVEENIREVQNIAESAAKKFQGSPDTNPLIDIELFPFYLFRNGELIYWSDEELVPEYYEYQEVVDVGLVLRGTGAYLAVRKAIDPNHELFGVIMLYEDKGITNDYLYAGKNVRIFPDKADVNVFSPFADNGQEILWQGQGIFKISTDNLSDRGGLTLAAVCMGMVFLSLLFFLIWLWKRLGTRVYKGRFESSIIIWVLVLFLLRYLMLLMEFPDVLIETGLFGSMAFASSRINPSLGDMLLNSVALFFAVYFVYNYYLRSSVVRYVLGGGRIIREIVSVALTVLCYFSLWYPFVMVQTVYNNSQITFDITETTDIDFLRMVSFLIFIISTFTMFIGFHGTFRFLYQLKKDRFSGFFVLTLISGGIFMLYQTWTMQYYLTVLITGIVLMNALFYFKIFKYLEQLKYPSFLYIFLTVAIVSILGAKGIYTFETEREFSNKLKFAEHFFIRNDDITEYYLNETGKKVREDLFISTTMGSPFLSKGVIVDKLRQVYLGYFFDKYDVEVTLLNQRFEPIYGNMREEFVEVLEDSRASVQYQTGYEGVYFMNRFEGEVVKRYIQKIGIERRGSTIGFIVIDLRLKKIIPNDVYFELLMDSRFIQPYLKREYNYAVFSENRISYSSGDFNYKMNFPISSLRKGVGLYLEGTNASGYSHVGLEDSEGRTIVVSSEKYSIWRIVTNFSFLFLLQVLIWLALGIAYSGYLWQKNVSLNFSARIQLYFNLAFFVPMVIVGFITLGLINSSSREEVIKDQELKANNLTEIFAAKMEEFLAGKINSEGFRGKVIEVAQTVNNDINFFGVNGKLFASSRPLIYDNNLLSEYIDPRAYARIMEKDENGLVVDENVGRLVYKSAYVAVKSVRTGSILGIISMPFFDSETHIEQQSIEILSTIINIFTIVFIVFIYISYFVSRGLTFPLRLVAGKLRKTTLTGFNEPLYWEHEDEIGLLVKEYNSMLENLEKSKEALARSEKESAWREIAQQVAHEIKNPLTPMKLTLQHLQRKVGVKESEFQAPMKSLLHHIDTLDGIATSFSSFAKMPMPELGPFDLVTVMNETVNLHERLEEAELRTRIEEGPIMVRGDARLMGRILSNMILNAAQSGLNGKKVMIELTLSMSENKALIEISDNGCGIDESIKSKIFVPRFTTKKSGSGIGLAIAKHGIEQAGGKIWFESEESKGTTFYIELEKVK